MQTLENLFIGCMVLFFTCVFVIFCQAQEDNTITFDAAALEKSSFSMQYDPDDWDEYILQWDPYPMLEIKHNRAFDGYHLYSEDPHDLDIVFTDSEKQQWRPVKWEKVKDQKKE